MELSSAPRSDGPDDFPPPAFFEDIGGGGGAIGAGGGAGGGGGGMVKLVKDSARLKKKYTQNFKKLRVAVSCDNIYFM